MLIAPNVKGQSILKVGLIALVTGLGLTLMPFYNGSDTVHFVSGLGLGIAIPTLLIGVARVRRERAG
jgi:hypothetical protein